MIMFIDPRLLSRKAQLIGVLEHMCQSLELTDTQAHQAQRSYQGAGEWLAASSDPLLRNIIIYLQGSTALLTTVNPICAGRGSLHAAHLVWCYTTAPPPISRDYAIRIDARQGRTPEVFVDDPDLSALAGGRRLPHVYQQKPPRLCLYLPNTGQWAPCLRIDLTFVPWAS